MNTAAIKTIRTRFLVTVAIALLASALFASVNASSRQVFNVQIDDCDDETPAQKLKARARTYRLINGDIQTRMHSEHKIIWNRLRALLPRKHRQAIATLSIRDIAGDEDGSVAMREDGETWDMELNGQLAYDLTELEHTIIHEYAHILSLNHHQVDQEVAPEDCDTFDPGEGCSYPDSIINEFHNLFWAGRHNDDGADEDDPEFVTAYAASNPLEDFAESFTFFVLDKMPANTVIQAKFDLIASFPELSHLASEMRSNLIADHAEHSCH